MGVQILTLCKTYALYTIRGIGQFLVRILFVSSSFSFPQANKSARRKPCVAGMSQYSVLKKPTNQTNKQTSKQASKQTNKQTKQ